MHFSKFLRTFDLIHGKFHRKLEKFQLEYVQLKNSLKKMLNLKIKT